MRSPVVRMGLVVLLDCAETDAAFYAALVAQRARLAPLVQPEQERQTWANLLQECRGGRGAVPSSNP